MFEQSNFPAKHNDQTGKEQAPGKKVSDKQHRGKHHEMSPVKNSAVDTAFIFNEETLKRAPDDDTDQIADIIKN